MNEFDRDAQIRRWRDASLGFSPEVAGMFDRAIGQRVDELKANAATRGHTPFAVLPTELDGLHDGDIPMGTVSNGLALRPHRDTLLGPTFIIGTPGSGKSTLLESMACGAADAGVHTLYLDTKNVPGTILRHPLPMLTPREGAISLAPPPSETPAAWLHRVLKWIEHACYLHSGSRHIEDAVHRMPSTSSEVCLAQVLDYLQRSTGSGSFKADNHRESAIVALRRLTHADEGAFQAVQMLPWERRIATSHGYYLRRMGAEATRVFALSLLFVMLVVEQVLGISVRRLRRLSLLDDARVIAKASPREGVASVEPIQELLDLGEAAGMGLVVGVQGLQELPLNLLSSASNLILTGPIDGADMRFYRDRLQFTADQVDYLIHQPKYQAIVHFRRHQSFSYPFPIALPRPQDLPSVQEAAHRQAAAKAQLLSGLTLEAWCPSKAPATATAAPPVSTTPTRGSSTTSNTLPPNLHSLLVSALSQPCRMQVEHGKACGIVGRELTDLRDQLVQRGLLLCHRLGKCVLWEATRLAARLVGRAYSTLPGRGSFPHRWLMHRIAHHLRKTNPRVQVEYAWHRGFLDVYAEGSKGEVIAYEVVLSMDTLDRAVEKLRAFPGDSTIVCLDNAALKRVQAAVKGLGLFTNAIEVITLAGLLSMTRGEF